MHCFVGREARWSIWGMLTLDAIWGLDGRDGGGVVISTVLRTSEP